MLGLTLEIHIGAASIAESAIQADLDGEQRIWGCDLLDDHVERRRPGLGSCQPDLGNAEQTLVGSALGRDVGFEITGEASGANKT